MATWQFDLILAPREEYDRAFGSGNAKDCDELLETQDFWGKGQTVKKLIAEVDLLLPRQASWSDRVSMWGPEDGDRVVITENRDSLREVFVRIDVRNWNYGFLFSIVKLAQKYDLVLISSARKRLEPSVSVLLKEIEKSDSFRFVLDPDEFLKSIIEDSEQD